MKNVIIGTAGHIDHGKTTLIKALTGTDTDRLLEEKKRGITIDLGFTYFQLPSGRKAGIVDVPGHEKFIKNMLAGVGGIDIVLLVIAADEGFMPQTQEHLDILSILEVKKGIVVLTKIDLVDEDWLGLVKEEIQQKLKNTFLEKAPIVSVSAKTGKGLEELIRIIDRMTEETESKNTETPFRVPIDRVFSVMGFGTVITGTQIEGIIRVGDVATIYPSGIQTKIRNIQVHGKDVTVSYAGQRVAINLVNVKKEEIKRGNVLAEQNSVQPTMMLDVKINLLENCERMLQNRARLRLYHGTGEVLCRVVLLDREVLNPGENCYAQLRLEEEMVAKRGDHFVVRFYSPMETIGGGIILEPNPIKHKRFKKETIEELKIKEEGNLEDVVEKIIQRFSDRLGTMDFYAMKTGLGEQMLKKLIMPLLKEQKIVKFSGDTLVHKSFLEDMEERMIDILNQYHKNHPLKFGISKEELRNKLAPKVKIKIFDEFIEYFIDRKVIKQVNNMLALDNFQVKYTSEQMEIKKEIESRYLNGGFQPPSIEEILKNVKNQNGYRQVLQSLIDNNELVKINENILIHIKYYYEAIKLLKDFIHKNGDITLSQFRDALNTSRKYALPLLEHFDQMKITKRVGEKRILL